MGDGKNDGDGRLPNFLERNNELEEGRLENVLDRNIRSRICRSPYWRENCGSLTTIEGVLLKVSALDLVGGTAGGDFTPTPFLCLLLRMLQLRPEQEFIFELMNGDLPRYVTIFCACYIRLSGTAVDVYRHLEPLCDDRRIVEAIYPDGEYGMVSVGEIVQGLLQNPSASNIALPPLESRSSLVSLGLLESRESFESASEGLDQDHVWGFNEKKLHLLEPMLRRKIYESKYWKKICTCLTVETIKEVKLQYIGGNVGDQPSQFICLILRLLQLQPEKEIIFELIHNKNCKYLCVLGAFYTRLVGSPVDVYQLLEPLAKDIRELEVKLPNGGYTWKPLKDIIDELLNEKCFCGLDLPRLTKRWTLELNGILGPSERELEEAEALADSKNKRRR